MPTYTPEALQKIAMSVYNGVYNPKAPLKIDRKRMPWRSFLQKKIESAPLAGADGVVIKYKLTDILELQGWERKDHLGFAEQDFLLDAKFPWANIHMGAEFVHDDIEAMGYTILPNQARGKNFAKADPDSDPFRLINYMTEAIEAMTDKYDIEEDKLLHTDNSSNAKLPQGMDAFWPIGTPTTYTSDSTSTLGYYDLGSVGGRARASYSDLQHFVWLNATVAASGNLRRALTRARREAELRSRGRTSSGIGFMMCGQAFLDAYVSFAQANTIQYYLEPKGTAKFDIGIPDSAIHFEGVPIVHNPTFEALDALYPSTTIPWTKRCYLIDPSSLALAYAPGKNKYFSAPWDENDVRVTRLSLDSKLVMLPKVLNANAVVSVA